MLQISNAVKYFKRTSIEVVMYTNRLNILIMIISVFRMVFGRRICKQHLLIYFIIIII
jgi:hypothetical protein